MPQIRGQIAELLKPSAMVDFDGAWYCFVVQDIEQFWDPIWVVIPDFDDKHVWGPGLWMARDANSLPSEGDLGIAMFDNRRNLWVPAWWPFTSTSQPASPPSYKSPYPSPTTSGVPEGGILDRVGGIKVEQHILTTGGMGGEGNQDIDPPISRGVLHDTEGAGDYDGQVSYMASHYPPHFCIGADHGRPRITQFYPLGKSADATAGHDDEIWCQIEIIAPNGAATYSRAEWRTWLSNISDTLQGLMASVGVPMVYKGDPDNRGVNWGQDGWFGHIDVPDNDHTDPGPNFPWGDYC